LAAKFVQKARGRIVVARDGGFPHNLAGCRPPTMRIAHFDSFSSAADAARKAKGPAQGAGPRTHVASVPRYLLGVTLAR
jgi:hypothetical protein